MSAERDVSRIVRSWLGEDEHDSADRVLGIVLDRLDSTPQRRSWWPARRSTFMSSYAKLAAAAAALVVVGVVAFNLLDPGSNAGTTPAPSSPAKATSTVQPTTAPAAKVPSPGPLAPGDYVLTSLAPARITFTVFEPGWLLNYVPNVIWSSNSEVRFGFDVVPNLLADPCTPGIEREPPVGSSVDELATALAAALATLPGIEPVVPSDVELGGYRGKLVDLTVPESTELCEGFGLWMIDALDEAAPLDHGRTRFWILDVEGTRLVITAVVRPGNPTLATQLEDILPTIRIEVP